MSVQAISWVLENSPARGTERLVLIAIANHCGQITDDEAFEAWPSVETIAREAALDRVRTAQDALTRLVEAGALERVVNGAPDHRCRADRRPNLYRILTSAAKASTPRGVTDGDTRSRGDGWRHPDGVTDGDTPRGERGVAAASNGVTDGDTQTVIEPFSLTSSDSPPLVVEGTSELETAEPAPAPKRKRSKRAKARPEVNPEAKRLCGLLAASLTRRGYKNVNVTAKWLKDMDLLIRKDGREPWRVEGFITWLDAGEHKVARFWRTNIRCPGKLREQWDRVREERDDWDAEQRDRDQRRYQRNGQSRAAAATARAWEDTMRQIQEDPFFADGAPPPGTGGHAPPPLRVVNE